MNIGFIGAGNIAYAIISGINNSDLRYGSINIYDVNSDVYQKYNNLNVIKANNTLDLINKSDIIFLAVKPQFFPSMLNEIVALNIETTTKTFVSVGAGISTSYIKSVLGTGTKVVRVMPNTPCLVGYGATAAARDALTSADTFDYICSVFNASGICVEVDENQINAVIAVSGSSPAYFFSIISSVINHGIKLGLSQETSAQLAKQTLLGSAKMLLDTGLEADELIKMVASPGGTTIAALNDFEKNNLDNTITSAMDAAVKRANDLEK